MPKALHEKLLRQANRLAKMGKLNKINGGVKEAKNAYVYGTLNKIKKQYGIS